MIKKFIAVADQFIPPMVKTREDLFKARLILYPNLCASIIVLSILFVMILSGSFRPLPALSYFSLMILHVSFLFILKKSRSIEWTGITFLCVLSLKTALETIFIAQSPINSGIHNFPLYVVFGFFISSGWKKRAFLSLWLAALTVITILAIKSLGFLVPFGQDPQTLIKNASIAISLRSLLAFVSVYWFVQIRKIADHDLDQEIEWQIRNEKLSEITNTIKTMFPRLDGPLANIAETLREFPGRENLSPAISNLENDVYQLKEVAQSISWVYRAYRNESVTSTSSHIILQQLHILLERSHASSGWTIVVRSPDQSINLEGPMPSLVLLLISLVDQIIIGSAPRSQRLLDIEFRSFETEQVWTLSWPSDEPVSEDTSRTHLIDELQNNIKAKISLVTEPFRNLIEIRGHWQSPTLRGGL